MILLNGKKVSPTIFPDKTSQVWKLDPQQLEPVEGPHWANIEWRFEQEAELIWIAQLVDLIKAYDRNVVINLDIPYMPYARQDKEVGNDSTFALHTFARLLNTIPVYSISTLDVHSPIAELLIHRLFVASPLTQICDALNVSGANYVIFPDKGAKERYASLLPGVPHGYCSKVRDQQTGEILKLELHAENLSDNVLIVDDICDGGRTFIEVAKAIQSQVLKNFGPVTSIHLYTTHGLYTKGTEILRDAGIDRIFDHRGEIF